MRKLLLAAFALLMALPLTGLAQEGGKIDVVLTSCRDLLCTNRTDVFLVGEGAYIDYNSSLKEISYSATLTFPNGTIYQITFPNRIISNVTGNYTVEMIAWKEGYEETRLSETVQFVDKLPGLENPLRLDWAPALVLIGVALTAFVAWRVWAGRKGEGGRKRGHNK